MREQLQARYLELDNEVKRQTKADKGAFIEKLADDTETAAKTQNIAIYYTRSQRHSPESLETTKFL